MPRKSSRGGKSQRIIPPKARERLTLKTIYERYHDAAEAKARGFFGRTPDAENAVQTAFLNLARILPEIDSSRNVRGLVATVTENVCKDIRKKRFLLGKAISADVETFAENLAFDRKRGRSPETPDEIIMRRETMGKLIMALRKLPANLREPLILLHYADFPKGSKYEAISRILGISVDAVKLRISRARAKLKEELAK